MQIVENQGTCRPVPPIQSGEDFRHGRGVGQLGDRRNRLPQMGDEPFL
ncbi:hypothetical protein [Mycolicibacterium mucogenicum]|nr:hypothetical protein [Mycolicibacterium mucogenicum]